MARRAALYEPFRRGPTPGEYRDCQLKRFALDQHRRKAAVEHKRPCPPLPGLWFLCARTPPPWLRREVPRRMKAWPVGFYAAPTRSGARLVVISELPRTRETFLLRMMGAGRTLRDALADFRALPVGAPERVVVAPLLVQLQRDLPRMQEIADTLDPEDAEDMMTYEEAVQIWTDTETRLAQAEQQITEVREQATRARHAVEHQFERRLRRALTDAERDTVRARFTTLGPERLGDVVLDLEGDALAAWIADPAAT
jgi:exonuclease VII small subunit